MLRTAVRFLIVLLLATLVACFPGTGESNPEAFTVLPAVKEAKLPGKLVFIRYLQKGNQLIALDLASGQAKTLFNAPNKSWLASAAVSPDGKQILLAYAPPPPGSQIQFSNTDLYSMPADGSSAPQVFLAHTESGESFSNPIWAPDGKTIYYTHNAPVTKPTTYVQSRIERKAPGEQPQVLVTDASWPVPSPDGAKISYLSMVQFTSDNELYIANTDGTNPRPLTPPKKFPAVDAHVFAPDGKSVYFSAVNTQPAQSTQPLVSVQWLGPKPVSAHTVPSDWFKVSLDGGPVTQVTNVRDIGMVAAFSPDGKWLAFVSQKGVFVVKPDGSGLIQLVSGIAMGSIEWIH